MSLKVLEKSLHFFSLKGTNPVCPCKQTDLKFRYLVAAMATAVDCNFLTVACFRCSTGSYSKSGRFCETSLYCKPAVTSQQYTGFFSLR